MPETFAEISGQVVVGLKLGGSETSLKEIRGEFQSTVNQLTNHLGSYKVSVLSRFITKPMPDLGWTGTVVLQVNAKSSSQLLAHDKPPYVQYWERNTVLRICAWNDPMFNRGQWGLRRIGALEAWTTMVNTPVTVAIVDSGLMWRWSPAANTETGSHEDLDGRAPGAAFPPRLWRSAEYPPMDGVDNDGNGAVDDFNGACFVGPPDGQIGDQDGHGTLLAGIMFAETDNALGLSSPATSFWPGVNLMPVKFFDADRRPTPANAKQAIEYAVDNGARVVCCSWHVGPGDRGLNPLRNAIAYARSRGVLVVAAAGNDGANNDVYPTFPANLSTAFSNVLAVHATDRRDGKPSFSNYGRRSVQLGAPGVGITTTARYLSTLARYKEIDGTSASAAFASIAAALVLAIEFQRGGAYLTPAEVIQHLIDTADQAQGLRACSTSGRILNLANAVTTPF